MRVAALFHAALVSLALTGLMLAADAKKDKKDSPQSSGAAAKPAELIWPLPPDPPRVRWLAEYTDMAKVRNPVVKKSSWLEKVTGTKTADEKFELRKPYGITTDKHGRIYAADTELKFVFMIDPQGKIVERREGNSHAPLSLPVGVAVDSEDRLSCPMPTFTPSSASAPRVSP